MSFFPISIDMQNIKVLVVGGGKIASDKIEKLLDFTKEITVITVDVSTEVAELTREHILTVYQRTYKKGDIKGFDLVIVATDTPDIHKAIYEESRDHGILMNSSSIIEYCDFIFPAYVKKGDLTVSFSTGSTSPAFAKKMREYFEKNIPDSVDGFLENMKRLREIMPKGKERMQYFNRLVEAYFSQHFK